MADNEQARVHTISSWTNAKKNVQAGKNPEDWIRLVSTDGYSYLVKRKVAMMSGTLRNMLNNDFAEAASNTCPIQER